MRTSRAKFKKKWQGRIFTFLKGYNANKEETEKKQRVTTVLY